jgi:acyl-CoA synthetase (AMP-forming)/AMP-acid ligase II
MVGKSSRLTDLVTTSGRREHYVSAGLWDTETLSAAVARGARDYPDWIAVVDLEGTRRVTYQELDEAASRVAAFLSAAGVNPGHVVAVQMPNWYETVAIYVGVLRAGAILNPLIPSYEANELGHMLDVGGAVAIITPDEYRSHDFGRRMEEVSKALGRAVRHIRIPNPHDGQPALAQFPASTEETQAVPRDASEISELLFTSGTEARPKAILHSEQTTSSGIRQNARHLGLDENIVVWMPSPIGHSTGLNYGVRLALQLGGRLVLQDRWDPEAAVRICASEKPSYTSVSTTFLTDMLAVLGRSPEDLSSLRYFTCAGATIPATVVSEAAKYGMTVLRGYGSSETLTVSKIVPDDEWDLRVRTEGRPLNHVEVELRDAAGNTVPPGVPGEVFVRGPATCLGFARDPERTAATFSAEGWVRTGDLATLDLQGYLTIVGRTKEIIIRGGMNIAPAEIEALLRTNSRIADVVVVGLPDARLGELVCACIVAADQEPPSFDEVIADLRGKRLATHKLPQRVEYFTSLPRTSTGKVRRPDLVAQIALRDREGARRDA